MEDTKKYKYNNTGIMSIMSSDIFNHLHFLYLEVWKNVFVKSWVTEVYNWK